jgi:hypothetical protein
MTQSESSRKWYINNREKKLAYQNAHPDTPLYNVWLYIRKKCFSPDYREYGRYGGRGIGVHPDWSDFQTFECWCINNGWKKGLCIHRVNHDGNYEPDNCMFLTRSQHSIIHWKMRKQTKAGEGNGQL